MYKQIIFAAVVALAAAQSPPPPPPPGADPMSDPGNRHFVGFVAHTFGMECMDQCHNEEVMQQVMAA